MMNSGEVSGIFAAQQQGFATQLDYAGRIGIPGGGLGMFGAPPAGGGGGFSYGPGGVTGPGFGSGNRFAGTMASGAGLIGGAANFGSTYLGLAGMAPSAVARFLPFGGFAASGAGAIASGGLSIGAALIGAGVHGAQSQLAFANTLGNYNFFNGGTRGGMGFDRTASAGLGQMTKAMGELPSMLTSMEELTSILGKLKSTGLMQGVTNATEFSHRFKEAIHTIRETAKILGTSMEEAESFFAHSRSVGFLGRSDQLRNALNVQLTSGMTGMSVGQVMQLQSSGANLATSLGARRSFGAKSITAIAQNIGAAQRSGMLSDDLVQDLTGLSGSDGIAAASERMTGLMSRMAMGTAAGQFMLAGMTKFQNGRAVLDQDLARQFNNGEISFNDLRRRGMGLSDAQKISFRARQGDLATAFAGAIGPGGMSKFLGGLVGNRGEDAENLLIQMNGGNASDADFMRSMRGAGADMEFSQMAKLRGSEANIRERTSPSAIMKRVMTKIHSGVFGQIEQGGADILTHISKGYDEFIDDLVGRHVVTLSKEGASAFARAMSGGNRAELSRMFSAASGTGDGPLSFTSKAKNFFGYRSADQRMAKLMGGGDITSKLRALSSATGGEGIVDIIDGLKAGNENFHRMDAGEQFNYLRDELTSIMSNAGASASMSDSQIAGIARGGGRVGAMAARIARAMRGAKGPAADVLTNLIASAENGTSGPRINLGSLYDSEAVKLSRTNEGLDKLQQGAEKKLRDAGLSWKTISAMKESAAVREGLSKVAAGDTNYLKTLWGDDTEAMRKLGISSAELDAIRESAHDVTSARMEGKNVSDAMTHFGNVQAASDISVIAKANRAAGSEAIAGSKVVEKIAGLKGYSGTLAAVGAAMLDFDKRRDDSSFKAAQSAVRSFVTQVYNDKSLTPEMRSQLLRASGTIGGAVLAPEKFKGVLKGKFTQQSIADKLGISGDDAMEMLAGLGFTSSVAKTVDEDTLAKLQAGASGIQAAHSIARGGQASMAGESRDDRLIATLQRIDANQSVIATLIAEQMGYTNTGARQKVAELQNSYGEGERNSK